MNDVYYTAGDIPAEFKSIGIKVYMDNSKANNVNFVPAGTGYIYSYPVARKWPERQYLYPISQTDMQYNPNLTQNPGW